MSGVAKLQRRHVKTCKWCGGSIVFTRSVFGGILAVDAEPVQGGTVLLKPTGSRMQPYRALEHIGGIEAGLAKLHTAHDCGGKV